MYVVQRSPGMALCLWVEKGHLKHLFVPVKGKTVSLKSYSSLHWITLHFNGLYLQIIQSTLLEMQLMKCMWPCVCLCSLMNRMNPSSHAITWRTQWLLVLFFWQSCIELIIAIEWNSLLNCNIFNVVTKFLICSFLCYLCTTYCPLFYFIFEERCSLKWIRHEP